MFDQRDEAGLVGAEVLPFVVLVFVVGTLMFAQAWTALDAKLAVIAGAGEAARAFVEHPGGRASDATGSAVTAGTAAISGYRIDGTGAIAPVGMPRLARCERVTFEASQEVPQLALARSRRSSMIIRARASEIVDPFRHGLGGRAPCQMPS
ncbi:hypothetical protein [Candidatus Poriferisodalis sp.]|uniref:hypothetical protein n=1 Tax=Candidatus Poriferisodalis sp. TaxID=3101277 RepID=UPI003B012271